VATHATFSEKDAQRIRWKMIERRQNKTPAARIARSNGCGISIMGKITPATTRRQNFATRLWKPFKDKRIRRCETGCCKSSSSAANDKGINIH
jgi:hypothetical protein